MAISDFYKNNSVDDCIDNGTAKGLRAKLSAPITTLYDGTVSDFDTSILIGFNTNNEYLNKYKKVGVATAAQGNYDTALNYNTGAYTLYVNEEWDTIPVALLGACLVSAADKGTNKLHGIWSLSRNEGITTGTTITNVNDLRFVLDVDGRGYNDLYASFTAHPRNLSGQVTNDAEYVYDNSVIIYYSSNLMSSTDNTDITPYETTITLCYVIKTEDDILLASSDFLFPHWSYYSGYSHDNDKYVIDYLMTGAYTPKYGYFGAGQNSYTYIFGNTNNVNNVAIIPDTSDKYGGDAIHDSDNYTTKYRCLQLSNARKMFNTIGLKWLNANETTDIYNNIKLPLMSNTREIDCTSWVTGLSNIKISESANVDLNINTMPEIKIPGGGDDSQYDDIGLTLNQNGQSFLKNYALTGAELTDFLVWCNSENVPTGMNPMDYVVSVTQAPCALSGNVATGTETTILCGKENTNVSAYLLGNQANYSTITIGTYNIPNLHDNFLNYEPYTHIDLYIPYCGTVSLPPSLFCGASLRVDLIYDIFSGECSGVVYCNGNYYTNISGNFMAMQAISSENTGAIKQAVINGAIGVVGGASGAIASLATGNVIGGVVGVGAMATSAYKSMVGINSIAPSASGGGGGRCNFYKPSVCILYITTPNNKTTDDFYKLNGGVVNAQRTLGLGDGFTIVDHPIINGNMTLAEKTEIENYLRSGVIL